MGIRCPQLGYMCQLYTLVRLSFLYFRLYARTLCEFIFFGYVRFGLLRPNGWCVGGLIWPVGSQFYYLRDSVKILMLIRRIFFPNFTSIRQYSEQNWHFLFFLSPLPTTIHQTQVYNFFWYPPPPPPAPTYLTSDKRSHVYKKDN